MRWLVLFLLFAAGPVCAQAVSVKSGDHADFTRLVLMFPQAADWQLGRTETGYELQNSGGKVPFDLSDVYRRITKARLKSIWADPVSGKLQLGVACDCHAIPFELDRNTLVIDIREGTPPTKSVFERSLAGGSILPPIGKTPALVSVRAPQQAPAYDWLRLRLGYQKSNTTTNNADADADADAENMSALDTAVQGETFRIAVIEQVAKGATDGIVEVVPERTDVPASVPSNDVENARIVLGDQLPELPGVNVTDGSPQPSLAESGETCPLDLSVEISNWVNTDADFGSLAAARGTILGEFDQSSDAGILNAVRHHLFFGFGAEARNLMGAYHSAHGRDALGVGISYLVDGQMPPGAPYAGMQTCDNAAAFWAVASSGGAETLPGLNGNAVARTFLGMPAHLKIIFAQTIVDRLLRAGDGANAEIVRSSLARSLPDTASIIPLLDAEIALMEGEAEDAERTLLAVSDGAIADDALLALVEARFQQRRPLDEKDAIALEAFAFENQGGARDGRFRQARTQVKALSGDFSEAFVLAEDDIHLRSDIWMLLAEIGEDRAVLTHAAGGQPKEQVRFTEATKSRLVRRLIDLGLPNAAARWLPVNPEVPFLAAEVALANNDGRTALQRFAADLLGSGLITRILLLRRERLLTGRPLGIGHTGLRHVASL